MTDAIAWHFIINEDPDCRLFSIFFCNKNASLQTGSLLIVRFFGWRMDCLCPGGYEQAVKPI